MEQTERSLLNNRIKKFILRIDFASNDTKSFADIINDISNLFTRLEKRTHINYNINVASEKEVLEKQQTPDYVLIDEDQALKLTFSTFQNALFIETSNYVNNLSYKKYISAVEESFNKLGVNCLCKRIGLRFINSFQCKVPKDIVKILSKEKSKIISSVCIKNQLSRIIVQEEYNTENMKLRVQYGIPNKYYPAVMTTYDILLDIDSFDDSSHPLEEWDEVIRLLNHSAYDVFVKSMNAQYIQNLI